jgi:hypothetical protein
MPGHAPHRASEVGDEDIAGPRSDLLAVDEARIATLGDDLHKNQIQSAGCNQAGVSAIVVSTSRHQHLAHNQRSELHPGQFDRIDVVFTSLLKLATENGCTSVEKIADFVPA